MTATSGKGRVAQRARQKVPYLRPGDGDLGASVDATALHCSNLHGEPPKPAFSMPTAP